MSKCLLFLNTRSIDRDYKIEYTFYKLLLSQFGSNYMSSSLEPPKIRIFCSYADEDWYLLDKLEKHLKGLERRDEVFNWSKHKVSPGQEPRREITEQLKKADLILLLISRDFIASDDCYGVEMDYALARHTDGKTRIVSVLLRPCSWEALPFSRFPVLPINKKPITLWGSQDEAFRQVTKEIELIVQEIRQFGHGYLEPLRPKPITDTANERKRRSVEPKKPGTERKKPRTSLRTKKETLKDLANASPNAEYLKSIPKRRLVARKSFFRQYFSLSTFKKRSRGVSGWLLAAFVLLDLILLPWMAFLWTSSGILTGMILTMSLLLFIAGVTNKEDVVGVISALLFIPPWIIIGRGYGIGFLSNYIGSVKSSPAVNIITLLCFPFFHIILFRKRR